MTTTAVSTRDPEKMTPDERADEVASLLARGVVRAGCDVALSDGSPATCLDLSGDSSLAVAPWPRGKEQARRESRRWEAASSPAEAEASPRISACTCPGAQLVSRNPGFAAVRFRFQQS